MKYIPLLKSAGALCLGILLFILIWGSATIFTIGLEDLQKPAEVIMGVKMVKLWPIYLMLGGAFLGLITYYTMVGVRVKHRRI